MGAGQLFFMLRIYRICCKCSRVNNHVAREGRRGVLAHPQPHRRIATVCCTLGEGRTPGEDLGGACGIPSSFKIKIFTSCWLTKTSV